MMNVREKELVYFRQPLPLPLYPRSVARHGRVDFRRPAVNAAREVVDLREALAREEGADLRAAYAVVADEDGLAFGVERRGPIVEEAQGEQARALDARELVLFRLAHVNQEQLLAAAPPLLELRGRNRLEPHLSSATENINRGRGTQDKAKVKRQKAKESRRKTAVDGSGAVHRLPLLPFAFLLCLAFRVTRVTCAARGLVVKSRVRFLAPGGTPLVQPLSMRFDFGVCPDQKFQSGFLERFTKMKSPNPFTRPGAFPALVCLLALAFAATAAFARGDKDWKPIDPAELSMTAPEVERDADAEALFWEVKVADDAEGGEPRTVLQHYIRIKIFNDRGRESQSKIDIFAPKVGAREVKITDIAARTTKPDGSIVELKKEDIFERTVVKASGVKVKAKSFAMPSVEPGAIIEYRWREVRGDSLSHYDRLEFSRDIPVRLVKYYIKPYAGPYFPYGMRAMPFNGQNTPFQKEKDGYYSTTMSNVPAFREEAYMPPEHSVRPWVLIYYTEDKKLSAAEFWTQYGKEVYEKHKPLMKVGDEIKRAAAEATAGASSDEETRDPP